MLKIVQHIGVWLLDKKQSRRSENIMETKNANIFENTSFL